MFAIYLSFYICFFSDLVKIYNSNLLDPHAGPKSLQNKVQFDIRYYMCRRGGENIESMTKDTFQLIWDNDLNMSYVKKVQDERTKNRTETNHEIITGFIPAILNADGTPHRLCPVTSFENYIETLNQIAIPCGNVLRRMYPNLDNHGMMQYQ